MKIIHTKSFHYRFDTEEIGDTPDEEHERDACLWKLTLYLVQPSDLSRLLRITRDADWQDTVFRKQENINLRPCSLHTIVRSKPTQDFLKPSLEAAFKAIRAKTHRACWHNGASAEPTENGQGTRLNTRKPSWYPSLPGHHSASAWPGQQEQQQAQGGQHVREDYVCYVMIWYDMICLTLCADMNGQ